MLHFVAWQDEWVEIRDPETGRRVLVKAKVVKAANGETGLLFMFDDPRRCFEIERCSRKRWRQADATRARGNSDGKAEQTNQTDR